MTEVLKDRFFVTTGPHVHPSQPDDPTPLPTRSLPPITQAEVASALAGTSNKSAPGLSGISYQLIKWAFWS